MTTPTQKSPAQLKREIDDHLATMRTLERDATAAGMTAANTGVTYDRFSAHAGPPRPTAGSAGASDAARPTELTAGSCRPAGRVGMTRSFTRPTVES